METSACGAKWSCETANKLINPLVTDMWSCETANKLINHLYYVCAYTYPNF